MFTMPPKWLDRAEWPTLKLGELVQVYDPRDKAEPNGLIVVLAEVVNDAQFGAKLAYGNGSGQVLFTKSLDDVDFRIARTGFKVVPV